MPQSRLRPLSAGWLCVASLAVVARLDRARTSRTIGLLVDKGLVSRTALLADPRRATVDLTAAGRALYDQVFPAIARINGELAAVLSDDALQAFDAALEQLTQRARELDGVWAVDVKTQRRQGGSRRLIGHADCHQTRGPDRG